ncbi:dihydroneopterin aldolase [Geobacillus sp. 46C-IIa]|uniref:dihydroneopterin aldolase n=2 Tax=Geobacillus sp. 46C-IIa TaxID=1963025 RepID=UPI0009C10A72|nr:dihydroneopterin aldolase [Geobacillus sp. 46C-IIa]OQP04411.1 dihydroneopterin aldolase [Geobacillus sp. 46C-IIa]QNU27824.1 dihydroneopterin aldolase [Geobacillus sp. 46C-IIa]
MRCSGRGRAAIDKIYVREMEFYGYHGVLPEEHVLGQRFVIDVTLELDLRPAGRSDCLEHTVNYADVYERCRAIVEERTFALIEAVAEAIADELLTAFPAVQRCAVRVTKPNPPIRGHYGHVAVEIVRGR